MTDGPGSSGRTLPVRRAGLVAASAAALVIAVAWWLGRGAAPSISVAPSIEPQTSAAAAVALARGYLDRQTPDLAAPALHEEPVVSAAAVLTAAEARAVEPRIPAARAAADPGRVVWVVTVSGDFLNLHALPWSDRGDPGRHGTIVIDDATSTILGVYPGP